MITILVIIGIIWLLGSLSEGGTTNTPAKDKGVVHSGNGHKSKGEQSNLLSSPKNIDWVSTTIKNNKQGDNPGPRCSKCKYHNNDQIYCVKCGWKLKKIHFDFSTNLTGVTYEGRQKIIAQMKASEMIVLKRDKNNVYDRNAVGVFNSKGESIGWVPKGYAANIAPQMDKGIKFYAEIKRIVGGNGYNHGVEVRISNDSSRMKKELHALKPERNPLDEVAASVSHDVANQSKRSGDVRKSANVKKTANTPKVKNGTNGSDSLYLNRVLLGHAAKESIEEVIQVQADFEKYKKSALPLLNRQKIRDLPVSELMALFDNAIMLAGGSESNFVHGHYKAIFVQLAFQLGFLVERLLPESEYAKFVRSKMSWLSTMDVKLETSLLQMFFDQKVIVHGESPIIYDSYQGGQIQLWDIDEIAYVLSRLSQLGHEFKRFIDKR